MKAGRLLLAHGTAFDGVVAVLALVLFGVLVMLALRRPNRQRLSLRIVLSAVAVASLVLMAWQPHWQTAARAAEAILLTRGALPAQVDRLTDSLTIARRYALPGVSLARLEGSAVERVPDAGFLLRRHPEIATVHVVGEGLPGYELDALRGVAVRAYPAAPRSGIQFVDLPRSSVVGQTMRVQGQVGVDEARAERGPAKLYLEGPGGVVDSVDVGGSGTAAFSLEAFSLEAVPRQAGRHRYRLILVDASGDTVAVASFGASVRDPQAPRVLVVQGAPRFETRALKNWLTGEGGRMVIRSTVSRDRYRTEYLNQPERDVSRLTPAVLRAFDVLLLDARALAAFTVSERRSVQAAVEEEGLGVLFGPDFFDEPAVGGTWFSQRFSGRPLGVSGERRVRLRWEGEVLASSIPATSYVIDSAWGVEPLMQDEAGRAVAAMRQQGMGRVGVNLAAETFRWVLEGNAEAHAAYWSYLLSALARAPEEADSWAVGTPGPIFRDAPVTLTLHTPNAAPRGLVFTTDAVPDTVYLAQDPAEPTRWHGMFWPWDTGWHRLETAAAASSTSSFWFYVHPSASWQALQAAENTMATKRVADASPSATEGAARTEPLSQVPVALWWFFVPFLVSSAGLWIESKL